MGGTETRTLWISLAAGLFASFLLYSYSQEKKAEYDKRFGSVKRYVVAKTNIAAMETIDETMLDVKERPVDFIEPGSLSTPQGAIGQVAAAPIKEGETILENKLLQPGAGTGVSLQVSPNKRAIAIPIDEVRGVSKLLKPGDRVDIIATVDVGSGLSKIKESRVLMQNIPILATGTRIVNQVPRIFEKRRKEVSIIPLINNMKFSTLTLELSPKEAQEIALLMAASPGSIYLMARNPNDQKLEQNLGVSTINSVLKKPTSSSFTPRSPSAFSKPPIVTSPKPKPQPVRKAKPRKRFIDL